MNKVFQLAVMIIVSLICSTFEIQAVAHQEQGKPVIFNYNESALPDKAFDVQGNSFGPVAELWYAVVNGAEKSITPMTSLKVLSRSDIYVSATLPDENSLPIGKLIAVWVKNGQQLSEPIFINRARVVTVEFEEIWFREYIGQMREAIPKM